MPRGRGIRLRSKSFEFERGGGGVVVKKMDEWMGG